MAKLLEVVTVRGEALAQIPGVDAMPNIVSFAGQLTAIAGGVQTSYAERALLLVKMELTREGTNCRLAVQSKRDYEGLAPLVLETLISKISTQ